MIYTAVITEEKGLRKVKEERMRVRDSETHVKLRGGKQTWGLSQPRRESGGFS